MTARRETAILTPGLGQYQQVFVFVCLFSVHVHMLLSSRMNGRLDGKGSMTVSRDGLPATYSGDLKDGERHGQGSFTYPGGSYR